MFPFAGIPLPELSALPPAPGRSPGRV